MLIQFISSLLSFNVYGFLLLEKYTESNPTLTIPDDSICSFFDVCKNVKSLSEIEACLELPNPSYCGYNITTTVEGQTTNTCDESPIVLLGPEWAKFENSSSPAKVDSVSLKIKLKKAVSDDSCAMTIGFLDHNRVECSAEKWNTSMNITQEIANGMDQFEANLSDLNIWMYAALLVENTNSTNDKCDVKVDSVDYVAKGVSRLISPTSGSTPQWSYEGIKVVGSDPSCELPDVDLCNTLKDNPDTLAECLRPLPSSCTYALTYKFDEVAKHLCKSNPSIIELTEISNLLKVWRSSWLYGPDDTNIVGGQLEVAFDQPSDPVDVEKSEVHFVNPTSLSACDGSHVSLPDPKIYKDGKGFTFDEKGSPITHLLEVRGKPSLHQAYFKDATIEYRFHGGIPSIKYVSWEGSKEPECNIHLCQDQTKALECMDVALENCEFTATYNVEGTSARTEDFCKESAIAWLPVPAENDDYGELESYTGSPELILAGEIVNASRVKVYMPEQTMDCNLTPNEDDFLTEASVIDGKVTVTLPTDGPLKGRRTLLLVSTGDSTVDGSIISLTFSQGFHFVHKARGSVEKEDSVNVSMKGLTASESSPDFCAYVSPCMIAADGIIDSDTIFECTREASYDCQYTLVRTVTGNTTEVCYGEMKAPLVSDLLYRSVQDGTYNVTLHLARPIAAESCTFDVLLADTCEATTGTVLTPTITVKKGSQSLHVTNLPKSGRRSVLALQLKEGVSEEDCGVAVVKIGYDIQESIIIYGAAELYDQPTSAADPPPQNGFNNAPDRSLPLHKHPLALIVLIIVIIAPRP